MLPFDAVERRLKAMLSPDRYAHSKRVRHQCEELAKSYRYDYNLAGFVGLAHDLARELSGDDLLAKAACYRQTHASLLLQKGWITPELRLTPWEQAMPVLAHGAAACCLLTEPPIDLLSAVSSDCAALIFEAVEHHTLGFSGMGRLTQILYAADFIEPGRRFDNRRFREQAGRLPLSDLVMQIVRQGATHDADKGRPLLPPVAELLQSGLSEGSLE